MAESYTRYIECGAGCGAVSKRADAATTFGREPFSKLTEMRFRAPLSDDPEIVRRRNRANVLTRNNRVS